MFLIFISNFSAGGDIFIRPRLNCYPQDDPRLIEAIKEHFLHPPSVGPYNLEGLRTDADGQPLMLDQRFFNEKKKGGFFIEAGAWDGEADSTSLHFELKYGWTGLLVEPLPNKFQSLLKKNRKAWAVQTCLSTQQTPETVDFSTTSSSKNTIGGILNSSDEKVKDVTMQCLPLYSILLALGNPTVDFLSLDIEGAEYQVLKNIPWKYVDIKAISVETQFAGEVFEGDRDDIFDLLTSVGYTHLDTIARDDVFVKLEPNQITPNHDIKKVLERKSKRVCSYFKVPFDKLSEHCKSMYPLDYFDKVKTENLPECLTRRMCPYDIHSLVETYKISSSWIITLSDGCMYK